MISVVVPAYNEESVIEKCCMEIAGVFSKINELYEIIVVNDGSTDTTVDVVRMLMKKNNNIKLINFSRNFGHQMAVSAGMESACGDAVVVIDADLQDPPELIPQMIEKWRSGFEIVNARRIKREDESFFKKTTARCYYRLLKKISRVDMNLDTGDFKLVDKKVCSVISSMPEKERYIRGLVCYAGYSSCDVEYVRKARRAGKTKYSLKKMIKLAIDGITSFSDFPLKLPFYAGIIIMLADLVFFVYKLISGNFIPVILPAVSIFISGFVLVCLGIIGEYISRIYTESKNRPPYIIKSREGFDTQNNK